MPAMFGAIAAAALCLPAGDPQNIPTDSRFELTAPLCLPPVYIHHYLAKQGLAQSAAHRLDLQARILWIDGTANLGRVNSVEKIAALCQRVADTGFNTIVFDIKPINGYTLYPSQISEQLTSWRESRLELGFDPLRHMVEQGHKNGLAVFVSMNAFSEGHSYGKRDFGKPDNQFFKPGWGYDHPELQTTRYIPVPTLGGMEIAPNLDADSGAPLAVYTDPAKAPDSGYYLTVEGSGLVRYSGTERPERLNGLALIAGTSESAVAVLRRFLEGSTITIGSKARFVRSGDAQNQIPLMMDPHNPVMQERALSFVDEIAQRYAIDGMLYDDRLRYGGIDSDFGDATRSLFEKAIGQPVASWPDDIYSYRFSPSLTPRLVPGRLFDAWLAFRSQSLTNWVGRARSRFAAKRPEGVFGVYAGSWYGDYQKYGNNYASPDTTAGFPFLTSAYRKTGFAPNIDLLVTGCYYPYGTVFEAIANGSAPGRTVEAGGILTNRLVRDHSWAVAGIQAIDFVKDPRRIADALQAATATTQGVMVFDLSHEFDTFQPIFAEAFRIRKLAPYQSPGLLGKVRAQRDDFDRRGFKDPPFPLFEGAPGTGF